MTGKVGWILVSRRKGTTNRFTKAGPYTFQKKSDFGNIKTLKANNPNTDIRFRKVRIKKLRFK
jgi:hypothetical protein